MIDNEAKSTVVHYGVLVCVWIGSDNPPHAVEL